MIEYDTIVSCLGFKLVLLHVQRTGKLLDWLIVFLSNCSLKVSLNCKPSNMKFIKAGVPQGSVPRPLFIYISISKVTLSNLSILNAYDVSSFKFVFSPSRTTCVVVNNYILRALHVIYNMKSRR